VERRQASASRKDALPRPKARRLTEHVCRRSASLSFVLSFFRSFVLSFFRSFVLSFFRSLAFSIVIAGLVPAIHAAVTLDLIFELLRIPHVTMDHRVKPGGDEEKAFAFDLSLWRRVFARSSPAARTCCLAISPGLQPSSWTKKNNNIGDAISSSA
jgi:hypothetical protein